jgi:SAM-dependent methyltransferase
MTHDPSEVKAGFERWTVFEKIRAANRMHHREVGQTLELVLTSGFRKPPRILDIGCGDAREISGVLKRISAKDYTGIDNSAPVLAGARANLESGAFPWRLIHGDYAEALSTLVGPFDLIWLGLVLHHLSSEQKQVFFQRAAHLLSEDGVLLAHDPVLAENEDRNGFIERVQRLSSTWPELAPEERTMLARHWSQHGRQERISRLKEMASRAGFSEMGILWRDAGEFYALVEFRRLKPSD